jgi:hypothetical protein
MPPKRSPLAPRVSPTKKPAAKPALSSAVKAAATAGSGAPPKSKRTLSLTKAPIKSANTKPPTTGSGGVAPAAHAAAKEDAKASERALLRRVAEAFADRRKLGHLHATALAKRLAEIAQHSIARFERAENGHTSAVRSAKKAAESREEKRQRLQQELCTAAFDGNEAALKKALREGGDVLRADAEGNFALGEAAVNGQDAAIRILIAEGADVNCRGAYGRTPLWRATFNGHVECVKLLLGAGADPRVAAQSQLPVELASGATKDALTQWDVTRTDTLKAKAQERTDALIATREKERAAEAAAHKTALDSARMIMASAQQELRAVRAELENRIVELDLVRQETNAGDRAQIAFDCVKECERRADELRDRAEQATRSYLQHKAISVTDGKGSDGDADVDTIEWSAVSTLLLADWCAKNALAARPGALWPFLVDPSARASMFFRYRNVNFVDAFSPRDLQAESIRKSVLGALRYGKAVVIDLHDDPTMIEFVIEAFDGVRKQLWNDVVNGNVRRRDVWHELLRATDGPAYDEANWRESATMLFTCVVLTNAAGAEEFAPQGFHIVRVSY